MNEASMNAEYRTDAGILHDIDNERIRQDAQWGGPEHDDKHSAGEWFCWIIKHVGKAVGYAEQRNGIELRRRLVIIAALAVAAIEAFDRKSYNWQDELRKEGRRG